MMMKEFGHESYVRIDEARVREKAQDLPENGVPEALVEWLPRGSSTIAKMQAQKAACPPESRRSPGEAMQHHRPNAVVDERFCKDGDATVGIRMYAKAVGDCCRYMDCSPARIWSRALLCVRVCVRVCLGMRLRVFVHEFGLHLSVGAMS